MLEHLDCSHASINIYYNDIKSRLHYDINNINGWQAYSRTYEREKGENDKSGKEEI